jgi:hypothetical protein
MITPTAPVEALPEWQADRARLLHPGPLIRAAAWLRRSKLDRALIEGTDPASGAQLAARAAQLTGRSTRANIATGLERLALSVDEPPSRTRVRPAREAAIANRSALLDLAALLRRGGPVYANGVARARQLVVDGTGPAYTDRRGEALARALELAAADLDG